MQRLILVTGGARSGKSHFAQQLARELGGGDVVFIATAEAGDEDMARRIVAHRQARPAEWRTVEAPRRIGPALRQAGSAKAVVVDCLTLLVSNVLLALGDDPTSLAAEAAVEEELRGFIEAAREFSGIVIVVTNEVGSGIVPANRLARLYRDLMGRANAALALKSNQVFLLVSGLPLAIKSLAYKGDT